MSKSAAPPTGALSHVRVLDLSRVLAGPWCAQMLGDLGADVIKVENPDGGDDTRGWGPPFVKDAGGEDTDAAYYLCANRNKRSIAVNLRDPDGQALIRELAAQSDVVIENFRAGALKRYGLDYESLRAVREDLIYCSITGFGHTGPEADTPGYDFLIQAMGGLMSVTGEDHPMKVGVPAADLFTGVYAASAVMAALIARDQGLGGQHIDMALYDTQLAMLANQAENALVSGGAPGRMGNRHPNIVPYQDFRTSDGVLAVAVGADRQFKRLAEALGRPDWAADPDYATNAARVNNRDRLVTEIQSVLETDETEAWRKRIAAAGVPCGPVRDIAQALASDQARARGLVVELERGDGARAPVVASPMRLSRTPPAYEAAPPALGAHTREVLRERLGWSENRINALFRGGVIA